MASTTSFPRASAPLLFLFVRPRFLARAAMRRASAASSAARAFFGGTPRQSAPRPGARASRPGRRAQSRASPSTSPPNSSSAAGATHRAVAREHAVCLHLLVERQERNRARGAAAALERRRLALTEDACTPSAPGVAPARNFRWGFGRVLPRALGPPPARRRWRRARRRAPPSRARRDHRVPGARVIRPAAAAGARRLFRETPTTVLIRRVRRRRRAREAGARRSAAMRAHLGDCRGVVGASPSRASSCRRETRAPLPRTSRSSRLHGRPATYASATLQVVARSPARARGARIERVACRAATRRPRAHRRSPAWRGLVAQARRDGENGFDARQERAVDQQLRDAAVHSACAIFGRREASAAAVRQHGVRRSARRTRARRRRFVEGSRRLEARASRLERARSRASVAIAAGAAAARTFFVPARQVGTPPRLRIPRSFPRRNSRRPPSEIGDLEPPRRPAS